MKSQFVFTVFLGVFLLSTSALARRSGGISDGGGNAVVCRDHNKKIQSATLLDLFEAEKVHKLKLIPNDTRKTYLQLALEAASRIDVGGGGQNIVSLATSSVSDKITGKYFMLTPTLHKSTTQDMVEYIAKEMNLIPDVGLSPIDDSNSIIKPKNCEIEQTAIYLDAADEIHIVEEIWNAFDNISKAGLLVHEALYANLRSNGEIDSKRARVAVGHAFAKSNFKHILEGVPNDVVICGTEENVPQYQFVVYEQSPGAFVLQFLNLGGKIPLSKTSVIVQKIQSPLGIFPSGYGGLILTVNFTESLLDRKQSLVLYNQRISESEINYSLGLQVVAGENPLYKVACNRTRYKCDKSGCSYEYFPL